ncbi:MAG: uncharacterized protein KVP18_004502 [Porospora cf. gigantea A]|nr:MAG: hypothetical protein KVP18_004502 [Porospora cf. gigantea A]
MRCAGLGAILMGAVLADSALDVNMDMLNMGDQFNIEDLASMQFDNDGPSVADVEFEGARRETKRAVEALEEVPGDLQLEEHSFEAETSRLMDIIVNSLYSNREVFLRELVSNAADALEKMRFQQVKNGQTPDELEIYVETDPEKGTLSIVDTGIGMTKSDLVGLLGTIAKSGSSLFAQGLQEGDTNFVGQFGVGFYSAFLVADKVSVVSKHADDDQYIWSSTGLGTYTVAKDPRGNTMKRGTTVVLHLKEDAQMFLDTKRVKNTVKHHSDFLGFPIFLKDNGSWTHLNAVRPIWMREKEDVTVDEYKKFYRALTKDYKAPLTWAHFSTEGDVEFKSIIYIPDQGMNFIGAMDMDRKPRFRIYSKRVLVEDGPKDFLPHYLSFVAGVADSDDFPMKVDRENLSDSKVMQVIRKKVARKTFALLANMARDSDMATAAQAETGEVRPTVFENFWGKLSNMFLVGCTEDPENRLSIAKIMRFRTTTSQRLTSLDAYKERMVPGQKQIYFLHGSNMLLMQKHPLLERFNKKGIEVIMAVDTMSAPCFESMEKHDGVPIVDIEQTDRVQLPDATQEETKKLKATRAYMEEFTSWIRADCLDELNEPASVNIVDSLHHSPAIVMGMASAHREAMIRSQPWFKEEDFLPLFKKTFCLNPDNAVIQALFKRFQTEGGSEMLKHLVQLIYETSLSEAGYRLKDAHILTTHLRSFIGGQLGVDVDTAAVLEVPVEFFKESVIGKPDEEDDAWDEEAFDDSEETAEESAISEEPEEEPEKEEPEKVQPEKEVPKKEEPEKEVLEDAETKTKRAVEMKTEL